MAKLPQNEMLEKQENSEQQSKVTKLKSCERDTEIGCASLDCVCQNAKITPQVFTGNEELENVVIKYISKRYLADRALLIPCVSFAF